MVPWETIAARLGSTTGSRTSAFALFVELALLTETSLGAAAVLGSLAERSSSNDRRPPRLSPDFESLARTLGYHRSRLTPRVQALDGLGVVEWDAEPGLRGTVRVAPWALGLAEVPAREVAPPDRSPVPMPAPSPQPVVGPSGPPQCVMLGATPVYVPPGTPLDFSARAADGRPALRFAVNGVEIVLPLEGPPRE